MIMSIVSGIILSSAAPIVLGVILCGFILILVLSNIRIVHQANGWVIERLGGYQTTWEVGIHVKAPFIDKIRLQISIKEQVIDFPPQPVITKDNVTMQIDNVIFFQVTDPKLYAYGVSNPMNAIQQLTATTLRNIIGDLELDETLTSRDVINNKMRIILDEATDAWGIKVNRVEVKNIIPPHDIQEAMEKQMRAEREKREKILRAEGDKSSVVLVAQGDKESAILTAEAAKQAAILNAEGQKASAVLHAEGEATAIREVQKARAEGIAMVKAVSPDDSILTLESLDALKVLANGTATKLIIPSDIQGLAGLAASFKEVVSQDKKIR